MLASFTLTLAVLAPLALADNRVFGSYGNRACQSCLADVESSCSGPISSTEFSNCFCDVSGDAWSTLEDCLKSSDSGCDNDSDKYDILLSGYGAYCFAYNDDEDTEVCVESSEDNELLLSLADVFCTEFITPTSTSGAASTTLGSVSTTSDSSVTATKTTATPSDSSTTAMTTTVVLPTPSNTANSTSARTTTEVSTASVTATESAPAATTTAPDDAGATLSSVGGVWSGLLALGVSGIIMQYL